MMVIKKYGQTSSLGRKTISDKRIDRRKEKEEEKKKSGAYVEQTAVYDKSAGGVITSEGDFYETGDTNWRPEGFVDLGVRKGLMTKKDSGSIGRQGFRGVPDAKVYTTYSEKYLEGKDKSQYDIIKDNMGKVVEIRAKPTQYLKLYKQGSNVGPNGSNRLLEYDTYVPTIAKFDPKTGNIVEEIKQTAFTTARKDTPKVYTKEMGVMTDVVKRFQDNKVVTEEDYDPYLAGGSDTRTTSRSDYGTYLKTKRDYKSFMETINPKPGYSGRETYGGKKYFYDKGYIDRVSYGDGRDYEFQKYSQPNVINTKLMVRDMADKMSMVGNTKEANRLRNYLKGGNLTFSSPLRNTSQTKPTTPKTKTTSVMPSTSVMPKPIKPTTAMTDLGMQSIAPELVKPKQQTFSFFSDKSKSNIRSKI